MRLIKKAGKDFIRITRSEWLEIGKRAQYFPPDFDPSDTYDPPDNTWIVYLGETEDSDVTEAKVRIDYNVDSTEYEGGHVFFKGGIIVKGLIIDEPFEFIGRHYEVGMQFPDELAAYTEYEDINKLYEAAETHLLGKVRVPKHRYPRTRQ